MFDQLLRDLIMFYAISIVVGFAGGVFAGPAVKNLIGKLLAKIQK